MPTATQINEVSALLEKFRTVQPDVIKEWQELLPTLDNTSFKAARTKIIAAAHQLDQALLTNDQLYLQQLWDFKQKEIIPRLRATEDVSKAADTQSSIDLLKKLQNS